MEHINIIQPFCYNQFDFDPIDIPKLSAILSTFQLVNNDSPETLNENIYAYFIEHLKLLRNKILNSINKNISYDGFYCALIDFKLTEFFASYGMFIFLYMIGNLLIFSLVFFNRAEHKDKFWIQYYSPVFDLMEKCNFKINFEQFCYICTAMDWKLYAFYLKNYFGLDSSDVNTLNQFILNFGQLFIKLQYVINKCYLNVVELITDDEYKNFLCDSRKFVTKLFIEINHQPDSFEECPHEELERYQDCFRFFIYWIKKEYQKYSIECHELNDNSNFVDEELTSKKGKFIEQIYQIGIECNNNAQAEPIFDTSLKQKWSMYFSHSILEFMIKNINHYQFNSLFEYIENASKQSIVHYLDPNEFSNKYRMNVFLGKLWPNLNKSSSNELTVANNKNINLIFAILTSEHWHKANHVQQQYLFEFVFTIFVYEQMDNIMFVRQLLEKRINHFGTNGLNVFKYNELLNNNHLDYIFNEKFVKLENFSNKSINENRVIKRIIFHILFG